MKNPVKAATVAFGWRTCRISSVGSSVIGVSPGHFKCCLDTRASGEVGRALAEGAETDGVGARRGGDKRAGGERDQEAGTADAFRSLESRLDNEGNGGSFTGFTFGFLGGSGGTLFGPKSIRRCVCQILKNLKAPALPEGQENAHFVVLIFVGVEESASLVAVQSETTATSARRRASRDGGS